MHLGMFDGEFPYIVPLHYGYQMEKGKLTFYAVSYTHLDVYKRQWRNFMR